MLSCKFASLARNSSFRRFLEAVVWLVSFQEAVHYSCNLLFLMLAFIKIFVEGKIGVGRREESNNMFLLAMVQGVPAQRNCGAGMQVKIPMCLVLAEGSGLTGKGTVTAFGGCMGP